MSNSEKTTDRAQVRFRDGDDLVEFEGSAKNLNYAKKTDPIEAKSPAKGKVRKAAKKNDEDVIAGVSSASDLEKDRDAAPRVGKIRRGGSSSDNEVGAAVKPPQPPPPPPPLPSVSSVAKTTVDRHTDKIDSSGDDPRSSLEERSEDLKLKYYSAFQTINRIHGGAIMKIKTGIAGITPAKDSFPMFSSIKKFTCFHWDADTLPAEWCVAYYSDTPEWFVKSLAAVGDNLSSTEFAAQILSTGPTLVESSLFPLPSLHKAIRTIPLSSISEIVVDSGNGGFRLYCGKEVVHFTPQSAYNPLARRPACWADAVYSALSLVAEADPELVQLHKQEFVAVLAQHTLGDTRNTEPPSKQTASDSNSHAGAGKGKAAPRAGLLRRRSTLSTFFGVGASKPLQESYDDQDTVNDGTHSDSNKPKESAQLSPNPDHINANTSKTPLDPPRRKMSLSFAVKMVRGAMKRSVSAPSSTFREHTDELAGNTNSTESAGQNLQYDNIYEKRNSVNYFNQDSANYSGSANNGYNSGNDSGSDRISVSRQNSQSSFLSQSVLSNLMNIGRHSTTTESTNNKVNADDRTVNASVDETTSIQDPLQAQINTLLEQNRALQKQLADRSIQPDQSTTNAQHDQTAGATSINTTISKPTIDTSAATTVYTSDTETSQSSLSTSPLPSKVYTSDELSTLRAFTARNNFHQNKSALKNTTRAFGTSASTTGATVSNTKYPFQSNYSGASGKNGTLSAQQVHENYGPGSKRPLTPTTHVLGKQTVLDLLLAQPQSHPNYQQMRTNTNNSDRSSATAYINSVGDDYYNDTIELEPQQVAQLIELQKLQREHERRAVSTDTHNVITTNQSKLVLDDNDCAIPRIDLTPIAVPTAVLRNSVSPTTDTFDNYLDDVTTTLPIPLPHNPRGQVRDSTSDHRKSGSSSAEMKALVDHALKAVPMVHNESAAVHTTAKADPSLKTSNTIPNNPVAKPCAALGAGIQSVSKTSTTAKTQQVVTYITGEVPQSTESNFVHSVQHSVPQAIISGVPQTRQSQHKAPLGQHLAQQTTTAASKSTNSTVSAQRSKQNIVSTDTQREQKLLSLLSGVPATPFHDQLVSSDEELRSDSSRRILNTHTNVHTNTSASRSNATVHATLVTLPAANTSTVPPNTVPTVRTNPPQKGFLARLSQSNGSKVSKVGNNLLTAAQRNSSININDAQHKERSYSADLSNLSGSERATNNTTRSINATSTRVNNDDIEVIERDSLHNLRPPQWSNSYYYHSPNNSAKNTAIRTPDRKSKKSGKTGRSPTSDVGSATYTLSALSMEGSMQCTLLNRVKLTMYVCARSNAFFLSETGILPFHAAELKNNKVDSHFLLLETAKDVLLVPLTGVASAELDTNNTGLFKLTFTLSTTAAAQNSSTFPDDSIAGRLLAQYNETHTNMSLNENKGTSKQRHSSVVSVVLKAEDTLSLVDWLTVLLDLKYASK